MITIEGSSVNSLWRNAVGAVIDGGHVVKPRGQTTYELLNTQLTLTIPAHNVLTYYARRLSYEFSVAEWLWMLQGRRDVRTIAYYNKAIAKFSDDGETFFGAYGPWLDRDFPYIIETLQRDRDSRQAVASIWRPNPPESRDVPCTVSIQYLIRHDRLYAHTYMRSNDLFLGFPYDLFNFTQFQRQLAAVLGVEVGTYTHTVGSLHIYGRDLERITAILADGRFMPVVSPSFLPTIHPMECPDLLSKLFVDLVDGTMNRPLSEAINELWSPWDVYASVIAYRSHKMSEMVLPPYRTLFEAR